MASMYGVYHGPKGIKNIALKIYSLTSALKDELAKSFEVLTKTHFDTLVLKTKKAYDYFEIAKANKINF